MQEDKKKISLEDYGNTLILVLLQTNKGAESLLTLSRNIATFRNPIDHLINCVLKYLERHVLGSPQPVLEVRHVLEAVHHEVLGLDHVLLGLTHLIETQMADFSNTKLLVNHKKSRIKTL